MVSWGAAPFSLPALWAHRCNHAAIDLVSRLDIHPDCTAPTSGQGVRAMIDLALIVWLMCAFPVATLVGYCALGEE